MPTALDRTITQAVDAMFGSFEAYWASFTPIAWPNQDFDPKGSGNQTGWVRVTLIHGAGLSGQAALGHEYRREAIFGVQVFTRAGDGRERADVIAERVMKWFEGLAQDEFFWFRDQSPNEIGTEGGWYQINCTANVTYDVIRNP